LCFSVELPLALFSLSKYVMRVALYLAQWRPIWLPLLLLTWEAAGQSLGPWPPLSFALPDQPPPPDHLKNQLIWVDSIKVIPLACCRMSLERLVETRKFPTTLVTLSFQLWN
jgi:hypothetical protein